MVRCVAAWVFSARGFSSVTSVDGSGVTGASARRGCPSPCLSHAWFAWLPYLHTYSHAKDGSLMRMAKPRDGEIFQKEKTEPMWQRIASQMWREGFFVI